MRSLRRGRPLGPCGSLWPKGIGHYFFPSTDTWTNLEHGRSPAPGPPSDETYDIRGVPRQRSPARRADRDLDVGHGQRLEPFRSEPTVVHDRSRQRRSAEQRNPRGHRLPNGALASGADSGLAL